MLSEKTDYSEAEWKLIDAFNLRDFASKVMPITLYREMAITIVKKRINSPLVGAVSRALVAMDSCTCYRMTEEFDQLVKFDV